MKRILAMSLAYLTFTLPVFANDTSFNTSLISWWSASRLYMGAYEGYGNISGGYKNDGQVTQGRLVLGIHAIEYNCISFGAEVGVQSGNDMRLDANSRIITATGGLPIQSTLKPFLDFLITAKHPLLTNYPLFGILKGGIAYRQLQLADRSSSRDGLRKMNGELQVGFGIVITCHAMLSVLYQGIYAESDAGVSTNSVGDTTISHIPTQQAVFLGLEYSF